MELINRKQFQKLTPEQQHSNYLHRLSGILNTLNGRLQRGDFLGAYSSLHNTAEHLAQYCRLDTTIQPIEGDTQAVLNYFREGNCEKAYAVLKYQKQQLKTQGYKYQH